MNIKSVSGLTCYVQDLDRTVRFYELLGFDFKQQDERHAKGYINWFWIDFVPADSETKAEFKKDALATKKGDGLYTYLGVDDIDAAYGELIAKGFKPSSEPRDWPWGNREFALRDPDGYKLVFFKKK